MTSLETAKQVSGGRSEVPGIVESKLEDGTVVLSPQGRRPHRRILFINSYGGVSAWEKIKAGTMPPHHFWGCIELVQMGYEVAVAEPLAHFNPFRRQFPHDLRFLKILRHWLGRDDLIYCGHTLLFWLPLLKAVGLSRKRIVSLTYAREELHFARSHAGIIALTPAAADQAEKMAPQVKVAHLGWGVALNFFPKLPYQPKWFLSCGKTHRDHSTLSAAATFCRKPIRVISPDLPQDILWPPTASLVTGGRTDDTVSYSDLLLDYYGGCSGSLIILNKDPEQYTAVGFTNLIEAMAMGRPVILTNTGALPTEINVDRAGCGLSVPAEDPAALAKAISELSNDRARAEAMGVKGRALCETHYNIQRFAMGLHLFFESL